MNDKRIILIVDDEENMRHMLSSLLSRLDYTVLAAANGREGLLILANEQVDVVLCDIKMPEMDGMEFLRQVAIAGFFPAIIMMSAFGSIDTALAAMQLGAYDYISKPFKTDEIELTLRKAEEREALRRDNQNLRTQLATLGGDCAFGKMVARSKVMQDVFHLATKVAPHQTTVLITGESGTGKELVAQGIHQQRSSPAGKFIAVNCGGLPETLIESELFGYVKGAFTGADRDKNGLFAEADGGTLFLDEIGELPLALQVKLLRALQENEVQPIGAARPRKVRARVIAATARDLAQEVKLGLFRQDLFYRLNVVHIRIPPLRERSEDVPFLADHFLKRYVAQTGVSIAGIAPSTMTLLLQHLWPGNVRELENVIERAVVMADNQVILPGNLPAEFGSQQGGRRLDDFFATLSIKQAQKIMESSLISRALQATGGNKSRAAELLEISYPSLLSKIKEYRLEVE